MRKFGNGDKVHCKFKNYKGETMQEYGHVVGFKDKHYIVDVGEGLPTLRVFGNKMRFCDLDKENEHQTSKLSPETVEKLNMKAPQTKTVIVKDNDDFLVKTILAVNSFALIVLAIYVFLRG